ncbi:MAG: CvpA family protein [Caldisericia bacterium]|nr:CvpA family protein [Caldisericia bacterium]
MNLVDGVIILILIYACYAGYKKGIFKIIISIAGFFLSIYLAYKFSTNLAIFLEERFGFITNIKNYITPLINLPPETKILSNTQSNLYLFIDSLKLPKFLKSSFLENINLLTNFESINTVFESYIYLISLVIAEIISFIILFLFFIIIFSILKGIFSSILHKIPIIGTLDRIFGLIINMMLFFSIIILIVFIYSNLLLKIIKPDSIIVRYFESSKIVKFIEDNMVFFKSILNALIVKIMEALS